MRRIRLILAALAVMVATFAAASGPAMADNLDCQDAWGNWIVCDGQFFEPVDNGSSDWWGWNPWWWNNWAEVQDCPFWGDTSGVVNQWDCFD